MLFYKTPNIEFQRNIDQHTEKGNVSLFLINEMEHDCNHNFSLVFEPTRISVGSKL